jgi:plasmid stabilization system protein ParE
MKYRTLKSALRDLAEIEEWVTEHFGPSLAFDTENELFKTFELLADFPQMGVARPDIDKRAVRFFLHHPYWISYSPGEPLLIRHVYHAARDLRRIGKS